MSKANLKVMIEVEVRDKNGKLISKHRQVSKSLLKNFMLALKGLMYAGCTSKNVTLKDTGGADRAYPNLGASGGSQVLVCVNAGAGVDTYGIQVGTGTTGVTRDNYQLATKIVHGTGAGQLSYGAMTVEAPNGTPPTTTFRDIRVFTNNTSASITVNEIGLVFAGFDIDASGNYYFLTARDVLSTPQTIPAGSTLTARYIFSVTA